jgi:hypothetical protein
MVHGSKIAGELKPLNPATMLCNNPLQLLGLTFKGLPGPYLAQSIYHTFVLPPDLHYII